MFSRMVFGARVSLSIRLIGVVLRIVLGIGIGGASWGVLLSEAQNIHTLGLAPWLLIPGLFIIVTVLAFNFVGDGLRDAADPYAPH